jgi:modulator of FtsH protease
MSDYRPELSVTDRLLGSTELVGARATVIKQTYLLLGVSVFAAMAGGYIGATSETILTFFTSRWGWIAALVLLNVVPWIAMACRHHPVLGVTALVADGFLAGLAISPLLFLAAVVNPLLILAALGVSGAVFLAITGYVMLTKKTFSAPKGLMIGLFVAVSAGVLANMWLQMGWLGMLISIGVGVMGVLGLVYSTSGVLNSADADSPIPGALALFAGLFNVFVATLNILLRLAGGGRRS